MKQNREIELRPIILRHSLIMACIAVIIAATAAYGMGYDAAAEETRGFYIVFDTYEKGGWQFTKRSCTIQNLTFHECRKIEGCSVGSRWASVPPHLDCEALAWG